MRHLALLSLLSSLSATPALACGLEAQVPDVLLADLMEFVDELPEDQAEHLSEQVGLNLARFADASEVARPIPERPRRRFLGIRLGARRN